MCISKRAKTCSVCTTLNFFNLNPNPRFVLALQRQRQGTNTNIKKMRSVSDCEEMSKYLKKFLFVLLTSNS